MAIDEEIDLEKTGLEDLDPEDMVDSISEEILNESDDRDDIGDGEDEEDMYSSFPLDEDDDVGETAEDLGVIRGEHEEEQEVDVTRVPWQSNIDNSPPPDPAIPEALLEDENEEEENKENIDDLETEIEDLV